ncbi:DUF1266 domain-containing protein [Spirillospora sp. NPDC029432]|uniref:DUF1266 domain-containing protein n=1 Tax=Spirillospora sp. NPDC029432 TaxID=3154599 RepID=UPI003456827A
MKISTALDRARKYERRGESAEAAAGYAEAAGALEARGDLASAVAVRARQARALADAGRVRDALRILDAAERAAAGLPDAGGLRAVLDGQAAHVLEGAGRVKEARGRALAALDGFRALGDGRRAGRVAVHAARLAVRESGPRAAVPALRELLAVLAPDGEAHRRVAALLEEAERRPDRDHDVVVTHPGAAPWGRLAAALAVGAHLAVGNGAAWNLPDGRDEDPAGVRERLAQSWGVTDAEGWREQIDALLHAENSDPAIQAVLDLRRPEQDEYAWQDAITAWCSGEDIADETARELVGLSTLILRYEARFRADGLLGPGDRVATVSGYDYGRAVNMARWGRNAGFCDAATAEECVLRAGDLARRSYGSWEEFSAGYTLGRLLRFDEGEFGTWYDRSIAAHRILTGAPDSPWRTLAWG